MYSEMICFFSSPEGKDLETLQTNEYIHIEYLLEYLLSSISILPIRDKA